MKTKIYLRIAKDGSKIKVDASQKTKIEPIREGTHRYSKPMPTVFLAMDIEIPDEAFKPPNISVMISVPVERCGTAIEVVDPMKLL